MPGADTVGRGLKELSEEDTVYKSESSGMSYRFNTAEKLNVLLLRMIRRMGLIKVGSELGVVIERFRADCGSFSKEIVRTVEERSNTFYIRASWLFQSLRGVSQP